MSLRLAALLLALPLPLAAQPTVAQPPVAQALAPPLRAAASLDVPTAAGTARAVVLVDEEVIPVRLEITLPGVPVRVQAIALDGGEPLVEGSFHAEDLDEDGRPEILLLAWEHRANNSFYAWRSDAVTGAFAAVAEFEDVSRPQVDPGTGCIDGHWATGPGNDTCAERWCWREGVLVLVKTVSQVYDHEGELYVRVTEELRGDALVETDRQIFTEEELFGEP